MPKVVQVVYSITKQVRQYEPVRIEVVVAPDEIAGMPETSQDLLEHARGLAEEAMRDALVRARTGATGF